jgi:hypothetical protein
MGRQAAGRAANAWPDCQCAQIIWAACWALAWPVEGWDGAGAVVDSVICRLLRQLAQLPQNFVYNFGLDGNVKQFQVI